MTHLTNILWSFFSSEEAYHNIMGKKQTYLYFFSFGQGFILTTDCNVVFVAQSSHGLHTG